MLYILLHVIMQISLQEFAISTIFGNCTIDIGTNEYAL